MAAADEHRAALNSELLSKEARPFDFSSSNDGEQPGKSSSGSFLQKVWFPFPFRLGVNHFPLNGQTPVWCMPLKEVNVDLFGHLFRCFDRDGMVNFLRPKEAREPVGNENKV